MSQGSSPPASAPTAASAAPAPPAGLPPAYTAAVDAENASFTTTVAPLQSAVQSAETAAQAPNQALWNAQSARRTAEQNHLNNLKALAQQYGVTLPPHYANMFGR